jgi:iron complex transport system substrate-binding protein
MRSRLAAALAAVLALGAAGACAQGSASPAAPTSAPGSAAERIVPLNGDVAEIVFALGLGPRVVGTDTSATYPAEAKALPKIGYQRQLSAEGILSLNPTIAIGTPEAGPPEVLDQIRGAGVRVEILASPTTVDDVPGRIRDVAAALGVAAAGADLADRAEADITAAVAAVPAGATKPRVAFLYLRGTTTAMIGGAGSRADAMITAAGAVDAGTEAGVRGFRPLTPEALATARPDVLLLLSAGLASVGGEAGLLKLPGVAQTPAGANKRIVALDDQYLLGLGPRTGAALAELVTELHGQ